MFIFYSISIENNANYHSLAMTQADGSSHAWLEGGNLHHSQ